MNRVQEYPSPRPVWSFEDWLEWKFTGHCDNLDVSQLAGPMDHLETRNTYAEYVVWTWEDPQILISNFSVEQIGAAMRSESHIMVNLMAPRPLRMRAWSALSTIFQELFRKLCSPDLIESRDADLEIPSIDYACYRWWYESPYWHGNSDLSQLDHEGFLRICEECLLSGHPALQESALHGLGLAQTGTRLPGAATLINNFASGSGIDGRLVDFAKVALQGIY